MKHKRYISLSDTACLWVYFAVIHRGALLEHSPRPVRVSQTDIYQDFSVNLHHSLSLSHLISHTHKKKTKSTRAEKNDLETR